MGFFGTAIEQRGKEERALRAFLAFSLIGSLGLHIGVLASGIVNNFLKQVQEIDKEPIEVAIIETPPPKPIEKPKEPVKPRQEAPKPKIVEPIKPKAVLPQKTVIVPKKPPVQPPKIVTPPVEKPDPKPLPKIPQLDTQSKPDPAPKPQADQNLKRTLRDLRNSKVSLRGGGGGNSPPVVTGSGGGTVMSG
ncbi:MAG: hypothetical protein HC773_14280, partial [Scytonema sp. CRU_2_7]|nr:hypothetical protein [Scytonema sp. CRU_2_7]